MELLHCVANPPPHTSEISRAKSEEKDVIGFTSARNRRQSLPAPNHSNVKRSVSSMSVQQDRKKTMETVDQLTSRTLSPPPETLPRKYSRSTSILSNHSCGRLPRHPELPPLTSEIDAPRLKDYLEKPRLVSTSGRRPSKVENADVDSLVPGLSKLTSYYNQTFLNVCDTCDSLNHKNPVSVLNSVQSQTIHRGM